MQKLVLVTTLLFLGISCSSKSKVADSSTKAPPATTTKAQAAPPATSTSAVTCTKGSDKRMIEVQDKDGGGCDVMYTKNGEAKSVANASHGHKYCQNVLDKMQKRLTGSGYSCQ